MGFHRSWIRLMAVVMQVEMLEVQVVACDFEVNGALFVAHSGRNLRGHLVAFHLCHTVSPMTNVNVTNPLMSGLFLS